MIAAGHPSAHASHCTRLKTTDLDIAALPDRARALASRIGAEEAPAVARRSHELASILLSLQGDEDLLLAALALPPLEAGAWKPQSASEYCGPEAARLAAELQRIAEVPGPRDWTSAGGIDPAQAENLRKLLIALASDLRLVLLRLALQLARMRSAKCEPEPSRRAVAAETREIYAPLANRLGIWQLKWELEDLAFRYLEPEEYKRIAGWLRARRDERERYIEDVKQQLARELERAGIRAEISGRPKHIYSIWKKMQRKGLAFEQVMDVLAVRLIVPTVADCYHALGIVHGLWAYVPGEFDDYIATPKENDYRSLHTAVVGPGTLPLEVQIRTGEMHRHAELGVAAHWQYKEGRKASGADQQKVQWLRQLIDPAARAAAGEHDLLDQLRAEVFEDRVYALSPRGEVVDLPRGATPLDFAYHVHTELGHRCRGARVNGRIVPLDHTLANGDTVEIIAGKTASPSRDWLVPQLGFLASVRNRGKVRAWFRKQGEAQNREQGKQLLEHELDRLGVRTLPLPEILGELSLPDADTLHRLLGEGELTLAQVAGAVQRRLQAHEPVRAPRPVKTDPARSSRGLVVEGVGDLLSNFARCCRPVPPESIIGYVTLGRGVSVHRADCANLLRLRDANPERVLAVDWGTPTAERRFPVQLEIEAYDRRGLVRDVSAVLADQKISIEAMNTVTSARDNTASIKLTVSVHGLDELSRLLARLGALPNVISARRGH
jgi:GTP pyrophosphokinase